MSKNEKNQQRIQSLDKGLQVLEMIGEASGPLTLQDIWSRIGWNKATILRILNTFHARGYLSRDHQTKAYTIGIRILALSSAVSDNINLQQIIRPYLETIVEETGETAHIGLPVNGKVVFVDRVRGRNLISANAEIGEIYPLYSTAAGKAYLAFLDDEGINAVVKEPLKPYTPKTVSSIEQLRGELAKIRKKGYALDLEEYAQDLRCVGAPIFDHSGHPIAMIGISGPKSGLSIQKCEKIGILLRDIANKVSRDIGFTEEKDR